MKEPKEISQTAEGVLVRLMYKIRLALGIDVYKLKLMIDRFASQAVKGEAGSKLHFTKVNMYNELNKDKMTIKVFFKFLKIIRIKSVRISITVKTVRDNEYTVHEDINLFSGMNDED